MPRKLVGDLQPGDMVATQAGEALRVTAAYHMPLLEAHEGKAWMIEFDGLAQVANSLDEIELAEPQ